MKTKVFGIFGGLLIIVGAVLGVIGMNKLDWKWVELDSRVFTEKAYEYTSETQLKSIEIDTMFGLNIVKGDTLKLKYYESEETTVTITEADGKVKVDSDYEFKWNFRLFTFKEAFLKYELTVPEGIAVKFDGVNANISASDMAFKDIVFDVANLNIKFNNCTLNNLTVESVNTDIELYNSTLNDVTIDSANLNLIIKDSTINKIETDAVNTKYDESNFSANSIKTESTNLTFRVKLNGIKSEYNVIVETLNGTKKIAAQSGSDPGKIISIDTVNLSGYLEFTA